MWIESLRKQEIFLQAVDAYEKLLKDYPEPHQNPAHQSRKITENYIHDLRVDNLGEE